ncbi:MAG TPA: flagellar basal body-associated FliL family protein [Syntrophales bacterium]|nr:flagellar basal body-associated FliL family protein [Syntrophales bacterium]
MARKVKLELDTLEVEEKPVVLTGEPEVDAVNEKQSSKKWPVSPWIFLAVLAFSMLLAIGVLSYRWAGAKKAPLTREAKNIVPSASLSLNDKREFLNDFLIIMKDDKGGDRVIALDVALELDVRRYPEFEPNLAAVRNIIYKTTEKKQAQALMRPEGRKLLKNEINAELAGLLGEGAVKAVYFTKFMVL